MLQRQAILIDAAMVDISKKERYCSSLLSARFRDRAAGAQGAALARGTAQREKSRGLMESRYMAGLSARSSNGILPQGPLRTKSP